MRFRVLLLCVAPREKALVILARIRMRGPLERL